MLYENALVFLLLFLFPCCYPNLIKPFVASGVGKVTVNAPLVEDMSEPKSKT